MVGYHFVKTIFDIRLEMSTSEEFAVVASLGQSSEGYYVLTVRLHTPFDFHYVRFKLWNPARLKYNESKETAKVGDTVKVVYENDKLPNLKSLTKSEFMKCDLCGVFSDPFKRKTRSSTCLRCVYLPEGQKRTYVKSTVQLIGKKEKMYRYSLGISCVFADANRCYFAVMFENDPLFSNAKEFILRSKYTIQGWVLSENEDGFVIKLMLCEKEHTQPSKNKKQKCTI